MRNIPQNKWIDGVFYAFHYNIVKSRIECRVIRCDNHKLPKVLNILGKVEDAPVVSVASYAFTGCVRLEEVHYPDTIAYFDICAFSNCPNLKCLKSYSTDFEAAEFLAFHSYACAKCSKLEVIDTKIPICVASQAFQNCTMLNEIIPAIKGIGGGAFNMCDSLKSLILADGIEWKKDAFKGCKNLKELWLEGDVSDRIAKTNLKSIKNKVLHCTSLFSHLDWAYEGVDIQML